MKSCFGKFLIIVLSTCTLNLTLYPELLIVKKTEDGFAPLGEEDDKLSKKIADILLKYQWPMCIMSNLSEEEKEDLLTSGEPYQEEIFIQKKINEALESKDDEYAVIFVPTTLYELFCIWQTFVKKEDKNPFNDTVNQLAKELSESKKDSPWKDIDLTEIINSAERTADAVKIRKQIYDVYKAANNYFFMRDDEISPTFYINNAFSNFLFNEYSELKDSKDARALSDVIKTNSNDLAKKLSKKMVDLVEFKDKKAVECATHKGLNLSAFKLIKMLINDTDTGTDTDTEKILIRNTDNTAIKKRLILNKIIALEYEARELNKALLLRGVSFVELQVESEKKILTEAKYLKQGTGKSKTFETAYFLGENKPYSLSYGNSLFAGFFRDSDDTGACAYTYLYDRSSGYALLINKKDYFQDSCSNLFLISPLAPIVALFQKGEWFHSRSKAAISQKKDEKYEVAGVQAGGLFKDNAGVLLIKRDPLLHAELFADFLAKNGRFIQVGDEGNLTEEEKEFVEKMKQQQLEAAEYYKKVRVLTPHVVTLQRKIREKNKQKLLQKLEKIEEEEKEEEKSEKNIEQNIKKRKLTNEDDNNDN